MADSNQMRTDGVKPSWILLSLLLLAGLLVGLTVVAFRPDRPVATIVPGSSSGPAFVVQVIRPRLGLPLGGIVPPQLFGLEAHLGFDSQSAGASTGNEQKTGREQKTSRKRSRKRESRKRDRAENGTGTFYVSVVNLLEEFSAVVALPVGPPPR